MTEPSMTEAGTTGVGTTGADKTRKAMDWRRIAARLDGPWPIGRYLLLSAFAVFALLCWLPHPYYGEEPVYSITTIESWWHGSWLNPIQLGGEYGRPPLLNWLAMPLIWVLGWDHMLLATRLLSAASTLGTGALLAWFAHYLSRDRLLAALAVACFLTGDLLMRRGWLAYSDPLFSVATFAAIVCLWVALDRRSAGLLVLAGIAITAAFLTKALTAYAFYGAAGIVLLWRHENRRFLLSPASLAVHAAVVAFAPLWIFVIAGGAQGEGLVHDFLMRANPRGLFSYVAGLLSFWAEIVLRMLPTSAVVLALLLRPRLQTGSEPCPRWMATLRWMLLLGALPYLATPDNHMRHVLPLYPLFAMVVAELMLRRGRRLFAPLHAAFIAWIAVTIPLALVINPWTEARRHGDSAETARLIAAATQGKPLYTTDGSSETLAVIAHLDWRRLPAQPIGTVPRSVWDGLFLAADPAPAQFGREIGRYPMGKATILLLCRGSACSP